MIAQAKTRTLCEMHYPDDRAFAFALWLIGVPSNPTLDWSNLSRHDCKAIASRLEADPSAVARMKAEFEAEAARCAYRGSAQEQIDELLR